MLKENCCFTQNVDTYENFMSKKKKNNYRLNHFQIVTQLFNIDGKMSTLLIIIQNKFIQNIIFKLLFVHLKYYRTYYF